MDGYVLPEWRSLSRLHGVNTQKTLLFNNYSVLKLLQWKGVIIACVCFPLRNLRTKSFPHPCKKKALEIYPSWTLHKGQHFAVLSQSQVGMGARGDILSVLRCSPINLFTPLYQAGPYQPYVVDLSPSLEPTMKQEAVQQLCKSLPSQRNKTDSISSSSSFFILQLYLIASSEAYTLRSPAFWMAIEQSKQPPMLASFFVKGVVEWYTVSFSGTRGY